MKKGLSARVSTQDPQPLPLPREAMVAYATQRGGAIVMRIEEMASGVRHRRPREDLLRAARQRDLDPMVVGRLDRWGRSVADWIGTLEELHGLGVGLIS